MKSNQKTSDIITQLKSATIATLPDLLTMFAEDSRQSVRKACEVCARKLEKYKIEEALWQQKLDFDKSFSSDNQIIVGIDEVGRGPLAGPVVAAAVILPKGANLVGLKDSKKLSQEKREALYEEICTQALDIGIGIVESKKIDEINILQATFLAMREALQNLGVTYDIILVDGDKTIPHLMTTQYALIKGDDKSAAVAAASVVAKVTRDRMMAKYALDYPGYDWENNKGYGSSKHYDALHKQGLTPLHRRSFLKDFTHSTQ